MSTFLRQKWLIVLRRVGVRHFKTTIGRHHPFICHVGDFSGENPFYNHNSDQLSLRVMAAWCADREEPVILDVGANIGFVATQLAQMLQAQAPIIVAFEPVWSTFAKLQYSVRALRLEKYIRALCCAISDQAGFASIAVDETYSLFAQLRTDTNNPRAGNKLSWVSTQTIDDAVRTLALSPTLLKIDVEGYEAHVLRGARSLLSGPKPPAILLEWNPPTLREVGTNPEEITSLLHGWTFFYVDDFEGQRRPFTEAIPDLASIDWVCNVFAVPPVESEHSRWLTMRQALV